MKITEIINFLEMQEDLIATLEQCSLKEEENFEEIEKISFVNKFLRTNLVTLSLNLEKILYEQENGYSIAADYTLKNNDSDKIEKTLKKLISIENTLYKFTDLSEVQTKQQQILNFPYHNLSKEEKHQLELKTLSIISDRFF